MACEQSARRLGDGRSRGAPPRHLAGGDSTTRRAEGESASPGAKGEPAIRASKGETTRLQLVDATLTCIREGGFASLSARLIATRAGLNQALVFYHFESLTGLVAAAYGVALERAMATYRAELLPVRSLDALIDRAEALVLHERDAGAGHGVLMVQLMAQAQHELALAVVARDALGAWRALACEVLDEALDESSAAVVIDRAALADALVTALLGAVLVGSVAARVPQPAAGSGQLADGDGRRRAERERSETDGVSGFAALRDAARMLAAFDALPAAVRRVVVASLERARDRDPRASG